MTESQTPAARPQAWWQFSLRALVLLMIVIAAAVGWLNARQHNQQHPALRILVGHAQFEPNDAIEIAADALRQPPLPLIYGKDGYSEDLDGHFILIRAVDIQSDKQVDEAELLDNYLDLVLEMLRAQPAGREMTTTVASSTSPAMRGMDIELQDARGYLYALIIRPSPESVLVKTYVHLIPR